MGWLIIVGSIPIIVLGLLFQDQIETDLRDLRIIAIALVAFSLILYWPTGGARRSASSSTSPSAHGVVYGLAQALALIPGVSRSGGTITAGLFLGYTRAAAARYSFLLAIPAVLGSGLYEVYKTFKGGVAGRTGRVGADDRGHRARLRVGLTRDRLAAALPQPRQLHAVRRLPHRPRPAGARAGRYRRPQTRPEPVAAAPPPRLRAVTTVLLLRHGRTTANAGGVLAGWTPGVQLDETGTAQVQAVGERLAKVPLAAIVSSPLERCRQTADAVAAAASSRCRPTTGSVRPATATGPAGRSRSWSRSRSGRSCSSTRRPRCSPGRRGRGWRRPRPARWPPSASGTPSSGPDAVWLACSHGDVIKAILADALGPAPRPVPADRRRPGLGLGGHLHRDPAVRRPGQRHRR